MVPIGLVSKDYGLLLLRLKNNLAFLKHLLNYRYTALQSTLKAVMY